MKRFLTCLCIAALLLSLPLGVTAAAEPLKVNGMAMRYNLEPTKDSNFWKWMEQEFNVDYNVEWVPWDAYNAKLDLILASGDIPDILQIGNMTYPSVQKAAAAGAFWDLGPLLGPNFENYPGFAKNTSASAWQLNAVKGKMYLVPNTRGSINVALFVRKDWLDKLGMALPTTLEEYADYLVAVGTGDLDGNGVNDSIGFIPNRFFLFDDAFGLRTPHYNEAGGLVHMNFLPEYVDMIAYFRDIYERGGIAKEYALIKLQQGEELFLNGTLGALEVNLWHNFRFNDTMKKQNPAYEVEPILFLKGPKGYVNHFDPGYAGGHVFSKSMSEEKVKAALAFFEKQTDPKYFNNMFYGVEGLHYTMVDGVPVLTDLGKQEVTNSLYQPFTWTMDEWSKVNSPLAPPEYNAAMREKAKALYDIERNVAIWDIIQSETWSTEWPQVRDTFTAMTVKAITGEITLDEFHAYQQTFLDNPVYQQTFMEFAQSYTEKFPNN